MHKFKFRVVRGALLFALLALGTIQIANAATTIRLAWVTADKDIDPYAAMAHEFADALERMAPGQFNVKFFPNNQLGTEVQTLQQMQVGALDAAVVTNAKVATIVPAFKVNDLPFIYESREQAFKTLDGEVGDILFEQLKEKNLIGLGFSMGGFREIVNNARPVKTPADLDGLKIRVQSTDLFISTFEQLGANPVPMAWTDTFTAVQQGTIDGLEIPLPVIYANKIPEVTRYLSLSNHTFSVMPLIMSQSSFNRLSSEQQTLVRKAAAESVVRQREKVAKNNKEILKKLREAGLEVNEVANTEAFQAKVESLYDEYSENIGHGLVQKVLDKR